MIKVRMKHTVINGWTRDRLESGVEYDLPKDQASAFVPMHAEYVDEPPSEGGSEAIDLESLTVAQLKEYAAENGIELASAKKADIISEIQAAQGS